MRSGVARLEMFSKEKKPPEGGSQFDDRGSGGHQRSFRLPAIRREADAGEAENKHGPGGRFGDARYRRRRSVIRSAEKAKAPPPGVSTSIVSRPVWLKSAKAEG